MNLKKNLAIVTTTMRLLAVPIWLTAFTVSALVEDEML